MLCKVGENFCQRLRKESIVTKPIFKRDGSFSNEDYFGDAYAKTGKLLAELILNKDLYEPIIVSGPTQVPIKFSVFVDAATC